MKQFSFTCLLLFCFSFSFAQGLQVSTGTTTIDFESFTGTGFDPNPAVGQLESDEWAITGFEAPDLAFGDTDTGGDYARGSSNGGVGTGGIYAFNTGSSVAFGVQPGGSDFTPGTITLRIQNNTGAQIQELTISYDIFYFNDQERANSLNFSHSNDNTSYTTESSLDFTTPEASDALGWQSESRNIVLTGLSIADNAQYYLRWTGDDVSGSGSRDEYGIDNITITSALDSDTPPKFLNSSPTVDGINALNFDLTSRLDEIGTTFFVLLNDGAGPPTSAQVIAGNDASDNTGIVSGSIANNTANVDFQSTDISGFNDDTNYDLYVVAQDDEASPNIQVSPILIDIAIPELEKIAITEFMNNPSGTEPNEEWVELFNYGSTSIDLNGFTITDDDTDNQVIATSSLVIPSGGFLILTPDKSGFETLWTGGVATSNVIQYSGSFELANTSDEIVILNPDGIETWRLGYASTSTNGRANFFDYTENSNIKDYGSKASPGVVFNGIDVTGNLGYERNNSTTDASAYTATNGDIGSPLAGAYGTPLPVDLLDYSISSKEGAAMITWATASETNNDFFEIEKSSDGVNFDLLSTVKGNGNTNEVTQYQYIDTHFSSNSFYRLSQIDYDGTRTEFEIKFVSTHRELELQFYPNPFDKHLQVKGLNQSEFYKVTIMSLNGSVYQTIQTPAEMLVKLKELEAGTYYVSINGEQTKLVKR